MMTHANRARRTALIMSVTVAALTFGTTSFAQEVTTAEEAEVVIVTGSRIPRPDLTSTSPVSVTTGAQIALDRSVPSKISPLNCPNSQAVLNQPP